MVPSRVTYPKQFAWPVLLICVMLLAAAGCQSGTLSNTERSCSSSGGLLGSGEVRCTGSAGTASGSPSLEIAEVDGSGLYRLDINMTVEEGSLNVAVTPAEGEAVGGELSPESPLTLSAVVDPPSTDEIRVQLEVSGEEARGLSYEATLVPAD
jgi:hypothetical protein